MKPPPFDYIAPTSLEAALELTAQYGSEAKILAGGQSLIPTLNFRLSQPGILIDLNRIDSLAGLRVLPDGGLRIGAMTRQRQVERDARVAQLCPLLAETLPFIAHPQIRNRGTVGGSLVHADPAAELPVIAVALGGRLQMRSRRGERWVSAADFFLGTFAVDLAPDEVLTALELPPWPARTGSAFVEVARRRGDYALAGVAALVTLDEKGRCRRARLVYLNVGDRPIVAAQAARLLEGEIISAETIAAAADLAATTEIDPIGNIHASAGYQRHLTRVLTRRALTTALTRSA